MRPLSASLLLEVWEQGRTLDPAARVDLILSAGLPAWPRHLLPRLSVGQRDACLLQLRTQTLGAEIRGSAYCPGCHVKLDVFLEVEQLRFSEAPSSLEAALELTGAFDLDIDDVRIRCRPPEGTDYELMVRASGVDEARRLLLDRCVLEAERDGKSVGWEALGSSVLEELAGTLLERDPQAEVLVELDCAGCRHEWALVFDIGRYLWSEIETVAQRLVRQVDAIARTYGWSECEILRMSGARRNLYLEMARS